MTERILPMELKRLRKKENQNEAKQNIGDEWNSRAKKRKHDFPPSISIGNGALKEQIKVMSEPDIQQNKISDWFSKQSNPLNARKSRSIKYGRRLLDISKVIESKESIPFDLTPYTKVVLITSAPIPFLRPKASVRYKAMKSFLCTETVPQTADSSREWGWQHATLYFMYPSDTRPSKSFNTFKNGFFSTSPVPREEDYNDHTFQIYWFKQWQNAFSDVYYSYRLRAKSSPTSQLRSYFYVYTSEFTVCFYAEPVKYVENNAANSGSLENSFIEVYRKLFCSQTSSINEVRVKNRSKIRAVLSQSNARLRRDLTEANVCFNMPFCKSTRKQRQSISNHTQMQACDSALVFQGHLQVHGLYEYLLNKKTSSNKDVPTICSRFPFLNATLQALRVKPLSQIAYQNQPNDKILSDSTPQSRRGGFAVELAGFIFPEALRGLFSVLQKEWGAARLSETVAFDSLIEAIPQPLPCSLGLNILLASDDLLSDVVGLDNKTIMEEAYNLELELVKMHFEKITWREERGSGASSIEDGSYKIVLSKSI